MQIRARELRIDKPISCPLQIMLTISVNNYYTQKGALNRRAGDLDNLIQGPIDCLMRAGIIEDDSQIVSIIADKVLGPNEIRIKLFMFK